MDRIQIPVIDLHQDLAFYIQSSWGSPGLEVDLEGRQSDLPKMERAGLRIVFGAIFTGLPAPWGMDFTASRELARYQARLYRSLASSHEKVSLVTSGRDAEELLQGPWRLGILVSMEGAYALGSPTELEDYYQLGVRALGLTWNEGNMYAQGCCPGRKPTTTDYGLTNMGHELVDAANRLGVILDIAHASRRTALDVLDASRDPVILSHGAPGYGPRHTPHEILQALAEKGGVIGVTFITRLYRDPTLSGLADVIVGLVDEYGPGLPAIGTDYHGITSTPVGLETVDKLQDLAGALLERGLDEETVRGVFYGNALRVIKRVLG